MHISRYSAKTDNSGHVFILGILGIKNKDDTDTCVRVILRYPGVLF